MILWDGKCVNIDGWLAKSFLSSFIQAGNGSVGPTWKTQLSMTTRQRATLQNPATHCFLHWGSVSCMNLFWITEQANTTNTDLCARLVF